VAIAESRYYKLRGTAISVPQGITIESSFMIRLSQFMESILGGLAALALGSLMTYGAVDFGQRTASSYEQGVPANAVVQDIRPERSDPLEQNESTLCILEFNGHQVERRLPGERDIGEKLEITYVPDTMELQLPPSVPHRGRCGHSWAS
jgi:hypothetical protein